MRHNFVFCGKLLRRLYLSKSPVLPIPFSSKLFVTKVITLLPTDPLYELQLHLKCIFLNSEVRLSSNERLIIICAMILSHFSILERDVSTASLLVIFNTPFNK